MCHAGGAVSGFTMIAARACKAGDEAVRNGRRGAAENDGNLMCLARERGELRNGVGEDHVRLETHELRRIGAGAPDIATAPAQVDADVAVLRPSKLLQTLSESRDARLPIGIGLL